MRKMLESPPHSRSPAAIAAARRSSAAAAMDTDPDPDLDLDMDMDMETLADDAGESGGEAERNEAAEAERYEAAEAEADILRDRFRLSIISIATAEGRKAGMTVADPVVACIADLAFKTAEQLAKDAELFAQHAGRKSVRMDDVILTAHRNEHLLGMLRTFSQELKGKEPASERRRKKPSKKDERVIDIDV